MTPTAPIPSPARPEVLWDGSRATPQPPLDHPIRAEVVVVGAGIAGLTAALEVARAGVEVAVLDGGAIGVGATGHSSAKVTVLHGTAYQRIRSLHGAEVAAAYAAANQVGFTWLRSFAEAAGGSYWADDRAVTYAADVAERTTIEDELAAAAEAGLAVALADHTGLPFPHHGGLVLEHQGRIDPLAHLHALAAAVRSAGGRIFEQTRVTGVDKAPSGHVVRAEHGEAVAEQVLVTTGVPFIDRALAFARTTPERSYVVAVRAAEAPDGMYLSAGEQPRSLRRATDPATGDLLVLVGGEGHVTGRQPDTAGCYARLVGWAVEHLGASEVVAQWSTQDRKPVDELPFVGPATPGSSIRIATGFNKWGMTNGTVAGLLLADQALGREPRTADVFTSTRFGPVRAVLPLVEANAEVAGKMASGWGRTIATTAADVAEGDGAVHREGVRPVAVSVIGGTRRCLGAVCPHLGGIVTWNRAEQSWDCPLHGSRFDDQGQVLDGPAVSGLQPAGREDS